MASTYWENRSQTLGSVIRIYSISKSKNLNANIKLIRYRALIRLILTYACPIWEFAADINLMKLQRLQNRVLRAISNLDWRTPARDLHLAFKIPFVYDYITKLCRRQTEVILNHENPNVRAIGQGEARHRKHKRLLAAVKSTTIQVSDCRFWGLNKLRHMLLHNPALTEVIVYKSKVFSSTGLGGP
jgi:hypothetical protein